MHSPEVCLPGGGWEIAALERRRATEVSATSFTYNRAVIQKGTQRMLAYYWFEQQGVRTASGFTAKLLLLKGKLTNGRNDSGMVRLLTEIDPAPDGVRAAERRLGDAMRAVIKPLPRFVPPV